MNTTVEYEGKSVEEALESASRNLKLPKDKLQYDVISYGSTGIFGLVGVKKAKIRVNLSQGKQKEGERKVSALSLVDEAFGALDADSASGKKPRNGEKPPGRNGAKPRPEERRPAVREGGKGERAVKPKPAPGLEEKKPAVPGKEEVLLQKDALAASPSVGDASLETASLPQPAVAESPEEKKETRGKRPASRGRSRSRNSRGGGRKPAVSPPPSEEENTLPLPDGDGAGETDAETLEEIGFADPEDTPPENLPPVEVTPEMVARGREVLEKILIHISEGVTIREEVSPGRILYNLDGGNPAIIIGKRGQTLEAIQYVVDKIVNRDAEGRVRIQMDVEGYIETRKEHLQQLALKQAEKARRTGKPATIGQMNAHDRRIIHLALKDDKAVRTQSVGEGYYRRLVIFPKRVRRRRADGNGSEDA